MKKNEKCAICNGVGRHNDDCRLLPREWTLEALVARMKEEVLLDIEAGDIPRSVRSFAALDEHVDANGYGGLLDGDCPLKASRAKDLELINAAQLQLDRWLARGRKALFYIDLDVVSPSAARQAAHVAKVRFKIVERERAGEWAVARYSSDDRGRLARHLTSIGYADLIEAIEEEK